MTVIFLKEDGSMPEEKSENGEVTAVVSKKPTVLLVSAIIATLWLIFAFYSFSSATGKATEMAEQIGAAIAGVMIIPFLIIASLGALFNWLGWALQKHGFAITAGVLYCVSLICFTYTFGLVPCIVLTFIGVAKLKK
jgi:hypothetical protein